MRHPIVARLQNAKGALVTHVNQDPEAEFEHDGVFERAEVLDVFKDEEPRSVVVTVAEVGGDLGVLEH